MSSIVPGPKKKLEEEITAARSGAKPLDASALSPSAPRQEQLTGLDVFPDSVRTAIEAEHIRLTALDTNRRKTADRAVPAVVEALDSLLGEITDRLGKPRLFGKPAALPEPSSEAAELLGIPADSVDTGSGRAAVRTLKQLRAQLKDLETTPDHDRLTRISTLTIRLSVALEASPGSAALVPQALNRYTQAIPDPQWSQTFPEKLDSWKQALS
ncbi:MULTISPECIES: hypothetical protein [Kribbella]|uniref:Uncharacterized protein n=1 Tax=Kribbella karoonensis TaxID=324851 RepID=A0ABP4QR28_9ACTN